MPCVWKKGGCEAVVLLVNAAIEWSVGLRLVAPSSGVK